MKSDRLRIYRGKGYKDDKLKKRVDRQKVKITTARDVRKKLRDLRNEQEDYGVKSFGKLPNIGMNLAKTNQDYPILQDEEDIKPEGRYLGQN